MRTVVTTALTNWHASNAASNEVRRLFHGRGHSYPGYEHVVVTWFPPYLLVGLYADTPQDELQALVDGFLASDMPIEGIGVQFREGRATRCESWHGDLPETHVVYEHGLAYEVALQQNQNVGLFLDMGHLREHAAQFMPDANVLNLFAYTCAFSVSAIAHGARQVVNNDMSKNALKWGERNHALNDHDPRKVRMVPHNLFKSWWKVRQFGPYDVVIIDPPTNQRGSFVAEKSYGQILKRLPEFTQPGGRVFACLNSPFLDSDFLLGQMARWCPKAQLVQRLPLHPDFPDKYPERALKIFEFEYLG